MHCCSVTAVKTDQLTCYERNPVVCCLWAEKFTHFDNSWKIEHCHRHCRMNFGKLVGHSTCATLCG